MHTTHIDSRFIHDHFMEASLDKPPGEMFDLLACLYEKITPSWWKSDGDALSSISCPNMESWVSRATMNSETVEIGMKSCQNCILLAVLGEIRGCRTKQVRSVRVGSRCKCCRGRVYTCPYFPASLIASRGSPRPIAVISAIFSTLHRKYTSATLCEQRECHTHPSWTCPTSPWWVARCP